MRFLLSEQQRALETTVRRVLADGCSSHRLHAMFDGADGHDPELWEALADIGALGPHIPEEYGGAGLEMIDAALVAEALGAYAAPVPLLGHYAASLAILSAGNGEQRRRWLPTLASGQTLGAFAWSDDGAGRPGAGSVLHGSRLRGSHANVPGAVHAGLIVVRTADGRLAVVEAAAPGVRIRPGNSVDRTRRVAEVEFADTPAELLADGARGHGDRVRDALLVLLAADAFGGGSRCLEMAVEYARTRVQFGVPIGQFQAVKHQLANMGVEIEPARGLYWFAAHAFDHVREQAARAAALAKAHLTDIYLQLARQTIELHGGIGFTWDADVQIFFKRAMFDYAWLGTPVVQRARAATLAGW